MTADLLHAFKADDIARSNTAVTPNDTRHFIQKP